MPFQTFQATPLNRLRAQVQFRDFPQLNIHADLLTTEGIRLALEGNAADLLPAMTGLVSSPAPYMAATLTMSILRSMSVMQVYKTQFETNVLVGLVTIFPDTKELNNYILNNVALESIREIAMAGMEAGIVVTARGYYTINTSFFDTV